MVYIGETECTYTLQHLRRHQRNPPQLLLRCIHTNCQSTWTLTSRQMPTDWTSLKQTVRQGHSESGRNLTGSKVTSSIFSFLNICACCKELTIKETLRQRTELGVLFVFALFYFILFYLRKKDVDIILLWAHESVETVRDWKLYMTCVGPAMFLVLVLTLGTCET